MEKSGRFAWAISASTVTSISPPERTPGWRPSSCRTPRYPYHDWNERITAECYATNAAARILDSAGRILKILSNYPKMSFDFGPTLLSWLEARAPKVYQAILDADKVSQRNFSGHGSAIAQAYNHMIMPLANRRDKITQVSGAFVTSSTASGASPKACGCRKPRSIPRRWRFWPSATFSFTILAPRQARRESKIGGRVWKDVSGEQIDPSMAYVCRLPSGRASIYSSTMALFRAPSLSRICWPAGNSLSTG